ncbi:nucleotidyltransferase domain-containing protein [Candidatus Woesearchaeota archaeon]|nr:nucleotidyltransferase domain-containing protein [Candidatus Woesearchaeota archaeon]
MELNRTTHKILKALLENPLHEFKEIELINKSLVGKGSASHAISGLIRNKVLTEKRVGKAKILSLNLQSQSFFLLKSLFDQEKLLQMDKNRLSPLLFFKDLIKKDIQLLAVFGSTIAGTSTEESDIDVLIVTNNPEKVSKERKKAEEIFGQKFNLHIYTEKEVRNKLKEDHFIINALLKGILIYGYDLTKELFSEINKGKIDLQRLFFFNERINSAEKNYLNKDNSAAQEIIEKTLEQIIFYLLSEKNISYASKTDARNLINKHSEGKAITKIRKSSLREKIALSRGLIMNILRDKIFEKEGL